MIARDLRGAESSGGARLLRTDVRVAHLLASEARNRSVARLFGVSPDDALLVTIIALAMAAQAIHERAARTLAAPGAPSFGDAVIASGLLRQSAQRIQGTPSTESPALDALVLTAFVAALAIPSVRATLRWVRASTHRFRVDFDHRYGHLVRPSRPRARMPDGV
jgi:hypothetical protein